MKVLASAVFLVCFTQLTQLSAASSTRTNISLDEGRILVSWSYDEEADKLSFVVNASTVGWVGFGFAGFAPNKMQDYDLILAGYKEGRGYIFDMYSTNQSPPPVDSSQDYHLVMAKEDKGRTILHVERAANTGDAKDIQFTADSEVFFVWALHSSVDATDSSHYPFHDHRGSSEAKHLIFQGNVTSKSSKNPSLEKTPPLTSSAAASIMPAATSSYDTITGRDVVPSSADGYEFKATELSIALLQTVVTPLDSPSDARSSSISQTHLSQQIPVSKQFLAPDILQLSSSPNSSLNSTSQKSRSIYSDSSNDEKAGKTDEFNEDRGKAGKRTQWIYFGLPFLPVLAVLIGYCIKGKVEKRKIRRKIADAQKKNCIREFRETIRQLHDQISSMRDPMRKEKLLKELQAAAHQGLAEDLTQILEESELSQKEALHLVLNHLTNVKKLAKYLNENSDKPEELTKDGMLDVTRRLRPYLKVLCKLEAKGIDVSKEWVKNLCKKSPTLRQLARLGINELRDGCKGANKGEVNDVLQVILQYTNECPQSEQLPSGSRNETFERERDEKRAADRQNLANAKALLKEAKMLACTDKPEVSRKINEVIKTLELPEKWFNQEEINEEITEEEIEELLSLLSQMTEHCVDAVAESVEEYESNVEIITKASKGRALSGLYYSAYEIPKPTDSRLLREPTNVNFTNPEEKEKVRCITFCEKGLATEYVNKLTKLSCRTNLCTSGGNGMASVTAGAEIRNQSQVVKNVRKTKATASALYFLQINQKTFQFDRNVLTLSSACIEEAMRLVQKANDRENLAIDAARNFLKRYGSHFPTGTQTLGGIFFTIADVESQSNTDEVILQKAATNHLEGRMSIRFLSETFGIGGDVDSSNSVKVKREEENSEMCFSYSKTSMGPPAKPASFHKLLSYNSNWALIDRGSLENSIPVWELISDLGGVFEEAARVLESTWTTDEYNRETKWDKEEKERARAKEMKEARIELQGIKETHLKKDHTYLKDGNCPTKNADIVCEKTRMTRKQAYDKAIDLISTNPRHHFCQITRVWPKIGNYTLKCWKGCPFKKPTFSPGNGEHVLFFSKIYFYCKDDIPGLG